MSKHVFGSILTPYGVAANNRGETEGNVTTLQKILWRGELHTTVSAEAIRWALRYVWQTRAEGGETALETNRYWDDSREDNAMRDAAWSGWPDGKTYIDDDVLGFMLAEAAKHEADAVQEPGGKRKGKPPKGTVNKRRGVLELTRAVSTTPFVGDSSFNAKSGEKGSTSLYAAEVHATQYVFGFAMTPQRLHERNRVIPTLDAIAALGEVAGNHSRFLYDFSPESIVLRWTDDPAPRMLYAFEGRDEVVAIQPLLNRVASGDIAGAEVVVGGAIVDGGVRKELEGHGVMCFGGVKQAVTEMKSRIAAEDDRRAAAPR